MRKKVLSLILAAALAVSGMAPGMGMHEVVAAETEKEATVIDVTDYGAYPDSGVDAAVGIQEAVAAAKEASDKGETVVISFPEGRYDIYPDKAVERELYISNTVGADQTYKNKKIGIFLEDMENVTVDGNGSLFMFHGKMTTFVAIDCVNVEFKNFTVDFQVPTVIDVTVESTTDDTAILYIPECYNYQISGNSITWLSDVSPYTGEYYWTASNIGHVQRFDTVTGLKPSIVSGIPALSNVSSIEDLGNHRLKITYTSKPDTVTTGMCFEARPTVRDHAGTFFWKCTNLKLTSLDIQFLHGFGMVGQHSTNITLEDVDFETPADTGRASASYADFVQMSGCKGEINIIDCTFANPHDDPINIHGTFNKIVEISEDRKTITVQYMHNETAGFPNFFVKDEIEIMTAGNMITVEDSVREVVAVDGPDGMGGVMGEGTDSLTKIRLTLDKAIPEEVAVGTHVVENITYTPTVNIERCVFKEVTTRGILVTTRKPITIKNNIFDGTRMASIYISDDAQSWYESGPVRDVLIEGNTFMRGKSQAIYIEPTNPTVSTEKTVHSNIVIKNNTFFMENQKVLDAKSVENLTFEGNTIYRQEPLSGDGTLGLTVNSADTAQLSVGGTAELTVSGSGNTLSSKLYSFNGCKNVVIQNNTYDGGLNAGSSYSNMTESDITVTNDVMKIGGDNKLASNGTVYYESANEEVVKVSSNGVATAVGAGSTDVTAYMIVGGRKFPTNSVTFTVAGTADSTLPTGIELTADKENIAVEDSIGFTAVQKWADEEGSSAVTWKVTDAQTGAETDKAVITADGTLTAQKAGAVIVTASTVNGYEASKAVSIWQDGKAVASDISVAYADGNDKYRASSTVDGGLEIDFVSGGLYTTATPKNILLKELPENTDRDDLTLIYQMTGITPANTWAEAGIYLYDDADNYIAVLKKQRGNSVSAVALVREQSGSGTEAAYNNFADVSYNPIWMKLVKAEASVTAYFSEDGNTWTEVGSLDNCGFLSDNFKLAIASEGTTSGSMVYSDVTVNGSAVTLVEDAAKPEASNVQISYDEDNNLLSVATNMTVEDAIVKWAVSDTENGVYSILNDLDGVHVSVSKDLKGKYVKAAVIPMLHDGRTGDIAWSAAKLITGNGSTTGNDSVKSANAVLASASITGIGEGEVFSYVKGTNFYQTTAGVEDREITYAFAADDDKATVKVIVNGEVAEGKQGTASLHNARNLIEVLVTAEDQVTYEYYRFTISRTGDNNANLQTVKIGDTTLNLEEGVYEYTCDLAQGTSSMTVEAVAESKTAVVSVLHDHVKAASAAQTASADLKLHERTNEVTVKVENETAAEPTYYQLKLKVPDGSNANMEGIAFEGSASLRGEFDASKTEYTVTTAITEMEFCVVSEESAATVQVLRNGKVIAEGTGSANAALEQISDGEKLTVKIISPDKTEKTYILTVAIVLEPTDDSRDIPVEDLTAISESEYPGTDNEGPDDYILDGNAGTHWHTNWSTSEATDVSKRWIGVSLKEAAEVDGIRYLPRTGSSKNGAVTEYKVQYRTTDDGEWIDIEGATGTWDKDDQNWKLITFDAVTVKQIRVVGVHTYADSGNDAHMSTAEFRVVKALEKTETPVEAAEVIRVYGSDRNETSLKVADQLKEVYGIDRFNTIIVATGKGYADALTGSYLAKVKNAPILLTNGKEETNAAMLTYIKANATEDATIYILGKEAAVSEETEALLSESFADVKRLGGDNRLETNIKILEEAGMTEASDLLIATSNSFADSLSAAATGSPILLVNSKKELSDAQKAILAQVGEGNIFVLGGTDAVSEAAVEKVAEAAGKEVSEVEARRLAGANRFETSVLIAETFFKNAVTGKAVVACGSGNNYPDGLCGGPLASAMNVPLILTKDGDTQAAAYAKEAGITSGYILGGTKGLVSDESAKTIFQTDEIIEMK